MSDIYQNALDEMRDARKKHSRDTEKVHNLFDDILLKFLREADADHIADAFEEARDNVPFWYS